MWLVIFLFLIASAYQANGLVAKPNGNAKITEGDTEKSLPNFLILFADDMGYGDLAGTFGHPTSNTPNLKDLAKRSKVFTNFYVTSPVCSPSRCVYSSL